MQQQEKEVRKILLKIRMSEAEKNAFKKLQQESLERNMSNYARKVLLRKPVTIVYHNKSADEFLQEMLSLKKELNAIGHNFNQAVKKLHTLDRIPDFRQWVTIYEQSRKTLLAQVDTIQDKVAQLYEKWSQG